METRIEVKQEPKHAFDVLIGRYCENPLCQVSFGVHEGLTFGSGRLDENGYWEFPCAVCAREHERIHPEDGKCWPYEDLQKRDPVTKELGR